MHLLPCPRMLFVVLFCSLFSVLTAQETRLLRQPNLGPDRIAFVYGGDVWTADRSGGNVARLTATPAVEEHPHFSPDGKRIAFTSNRNGETAVYVVEATGGMPRRLTWHPSGATVRGWTTDGKAVLFASTRNTAPVPYNRLWTVPATGGPATRLSAQWGYDGSFSPDGRRIALDRMTRWDGEWRNYKGGQNTPLILLDPATNAEVLLPHDDRTTDVQPNWLGDEVFFLSDRDWTMNVWAYRVKTESLRQVTKFRATDVKWLAARDGQLIVEQAGYLHTVDPATGKTNKLSIGVKSDFPWAATSWEDVSKRAGSISLSPTGKRAVMEARGDIFTVPVEKGDARNLTRSSTAADRAPLWSPEGDRLAWFSDADGTGYALYLTDQTGRGAHKKISIGDSRMAWDPAWSPDGKQIAFVDDDVRLRVVDLASESVRTADVGTSNLDRSRTDPVWSPDSRYLAYVKSAGNSFRQLMAWDSRDGTVRSLTNAFADAFAPAWDRDRKHLYFLASTDVALGSGWANTSSIQAEPNYAAYVLVLAYDTDSPFIPESDEEKRREADEQPENDAGADAGAETGESKEKPAGKDAETKEKDKSVEIDFNGLDRRIIPLPVDNGNYYATAAGPAGTLFLAMRREDSPGGLLRKFTLKERKAKDFAPGLRAFSVSADGKMILVRTTSGWSVAKTTGAGVKDGKSLKPKLMMKLDRMAEWKQIFEEAWRYERDYFYDPELHGRDWNEVYERYAPLVPHVRHRADLTYLLDQMNGELSVGHSFVFGGDLPATPSSRVGLLGADLGVNNGRWVIDRIYTTESWNPRLSSPLDRPGIRINPGTYLVGVNGRELTAADNPYEFLDGTRGEQTVLQLNDSPDFIGYREAIVEPIRSENALRQRGWVEDNRRRVDELSGGKLAYVWVPNTAGPGFVSFNRYYFAQQDKLGAVIDERFNGGGLLDDYMVDLMTRSLRAAITNEVAGGKSFRLPAGILGPKVLLINELAGSGGDFFPWVFRQQKAGKLIGATTWGGLVKSSIHYGLVDGGALTAPDNAVFDPIAGKYIGENAGITPNIAVRQDAGSLAKGNDPQLERGVAELLEQLKSIERHPAARPRHPTPAVRN